MKIFHLTGTKKRNNIYPLTITQTVTNCHAFKIIYKRKEKTTK